MDQKTLIVGQYCKDDQSAIVCSLRGEDGQITPGVMTWTGKGVASALHAALVDAQQFRAKRLEVLTNHEALATVYTPQRVEGAPKPKICLPLYKVSKQIVCGSADNIWAVARELARFERWKFLYVEQLPKAGELWRSKFQ